MTDIHSESPAFLRKRRNLVILSLITALIYLAGISPPSQISLAGVEFGVKTPMVLFGALWVVFFYWLWEYWQQFMLRPSADAKTAILDIAWYFALEPARDQVAKQTALDPSVIYFQPIANIPHTYQGAFVRTDLPELVSPPVLRDHVDLAPAVQEKMVRARWQYFSRKPFFIDYWVPFFMAGIALIAGVSSLWLHGTIVPIAE